MLFFIGADAGRPDRIQIDRQPSALNDISIRCCLLCVLCELIGRSSKEIASHWINGEIVRPEGLICKSYNGICHNSSIIEVAAYGPELSSVKDPPLSYIAGLVEELEGSQDVRAIKRIHSAPPSHALTKIGLGENFF